MKNIFYSIVIFLFLYGCQDKKDISINDSLMKNLDEEIVSNSEIKVLRYERVVKSFGEKYPVNVEIDDSLLYVVMAKSDTCIYVYNIKNGELEGSMLEI